MNYHVRLRTDMRDKLLPQRVIVNRRSWQAKWCRRHIYWQEDRRE